MVGRGYHGERMGARTERKRGGGVDFGEPCAARLVARTEHAENLNPPFAKPVSSSNDGDS